jgi:hypothetical protein
MAAHQERERTSHTRSANPRQAAAVRGRELRHRSKTLNRTNVLAAYHGVG